jgi:hypothetical protein
MEVDNTCWRFGRICDLIVGLMVILVSYSGTLFAAHYFVTRL